MSKDFTSDFAKANIDNVRKAVDEFWNQAKTASTKTEEGVAAARDQAEDLTKQVSSFAEQNMSASLEFAQSIFSAKSPDDLLKINADFIKKQSEVLTKQGQELGAATANATQDAVKRFTK